MSKNCDALLWYHGKITREVAVQALLRKGGRDGFFLIRDCRNAPEDYVLSMVFRSQILHFQINCLGDNKFSIDNGPIFQGLDMLISYYKVISDGLPCKLVDFCVGKIAPLYALKYGLDTRLHLACEEKNSYTVKELLQDSVIKENVNARSVSGLTALHISCSNGSNDIVAMLLNAGADASAIDANGQTPVQVVCFHNHASTLHLLITKGDADFLKRSPSNGWVPLHEAAMRGSLECVKVLLSFNASMYPRSLDGDTPRDLALQYENYNVVEFFDNYPVSQPKTSITQWLHQNLDRNGALIILQNASMADGSFLIRSSIKCHGYYVLTLVYEKKIYHFQVKSRADRWFYIDDGPLFETLPHLVDHYMQYADGLPTLLRFPVPSAENRKRPLPPTPTKIQLKLPVPPSRPIKNSNGLPQPLPYPEFTNESDSDTFTRLECEKEKPLPKLPCPVVHTEVPNNVDVRQKSDQTMKNNAQQNIILKESISFGKELGVGEFGSVIKGIWLSPGGKEINVAMKTLHKDKMVQGEKEFLREALVMSQLNHPCIVCLLGVCLGPPMILVQELVEMGALLDYLMDYQPEIQEVDLKLWASQIAFGMMYLELKRFVHRDLAARNILLANKKQVKISDFGLSRAVGTESDYYQAKQGGRWPVRWYAPESINYGTFSTKSDVWSYGITLWEMFTFGDLPYGEMTGNEVVSFLEHSGRLEKPDECPNHTYSIMLSCWHIDPNKRPTFNELHSTFSTDPEYEDVRVYRDRIK